MWALLLVCPQIRQNYLAVAVVEVSLFWLGAKYMEYKTTTTTKLSFCSIIDFKNLFILSEEMLKVDVKSL